MQDLGERGCLRQDALGAQGYRIPAGGILTRRTDDWWLPDRAYAAEMTVILERPATPVRYRYDSLRLADFVSDLEKAFHIRADQDIFDVETLRDLADYIRERSG